MSPPASAAKRAPPGFTKDQWKEFTDRGFVTLENAISPDDVKKYLDAIDRCAAGDPKYNPAEFFSPENIVERDPVFAELIDHPRHIGYAWDLFGELTKVHLSQCMIRPKGGWYNLWHPDGPRAVPYGTFWNEVPPVLKVSYWLTDLPEAKMGNLVIMPDSHRSHYFEHYDTDKSVPGEHIVKVKAGSMTVMHCCAWHRVEPNDTDIQRKNFFYAYCPAWMVAQDRYQNNPDWLKQQTRERRILMRSYPYPYDNAKPPAGEFPLYLDRESGEDRDPGIYGNHVKLERRKRKTTIERWSEKA